jgi:hypothetical protein
VVEEHDREVQDLPHLDQRQRLEELVEGAEAAGEDHEPLGRLHEHGLARVEVVEREADVEVGVRPLLVRQLDIEADRDPTRFLRAAVRGLHHARPAAGHHGEARLRELSSDLARVGIEPVALVDPRGAEDADRRPADPLDREEALQELVPDALGVPGKVAVVPFEDLAVLHQSRLCGTWVPHMPRASSSARPR